MSRAKLETTAMHPDHQGPAAGGVVFGLIKIEQFFIAIRQVFIQGKPREGVVFESDLSRYRQACQTKK
jgi:hypothetical protein